MAKIKLETGQVINFEGTPTQQDIDEAVGSLDIAKPTKSKSFLRPIELGKSIFEGAKEEVTAAGEAISEAQLRQEEGEQGGLRTGFTTLAQGTQAGLSTAFRGALDIASAAIPDFIEDPIRRFAGDKFEDFISSDVGQKTVSSIKKITDKIDTLDPKNQQLIKDVADAALTGVDIASFGVGGKVAKRGLAEVGAKAGIRGEQLIQQAEKKSIAKVESRLADLVIDTSTPTARAKIATRTKEGGFFSGREITPNKREIEVMQELTQTPGIKPARSALLNLNATTKAIELEANALKTALKKDNFIFPKKELITRLDSAVEELKLVDPDVIGDAEKLADRVFDKIKIFVNSEQGNGLGGLTARQNFDKWVKVKKPKAFEKQDAYNTIVKEARNTINEFLENKATKTDIKKSLQRQSRLLSAQDVLKVKASKESAVGFIRLLDKATEALGTKNRVVQLLGASLGLTSLAALQIFAPAAAAVGGTIGLAALLVKALKTPATMKAFGKALKTIELMLPKATAEERAILVELRDEIKSLMDRDVSIGLSIEDVTKKVKKPITKELPLAEEAKKYKSAEEFVKKQQIVYHGSNAPLKQFDKRGAFFTDDMMNAEGYGGGENLYEGYLNLKNPLVIDAKGRHHEDLITKYGKSTQEVVANVDSKKYDGVIFKNINDSFADDVDIVGSDTIFYPFNANKSFINKSQLTDIWNKAKGGSVGESSLIQEARDTMTKQKWENMNPVSQQVYLMEKGIDVSKSVGGGKVGATTEANAMMGVGGKYTPRSVIESPTFYDEYIAPLQKRENLPVNIKPTESIGGITANEKDINAIKQFISEGMSEKEAIFLRAKLLSKSAKEKGFLLDTNNAKSQLTDIYNKAHKKD